MGSSHAADPAATQEKFGYLPSEIAPGSRKPLVFTCEFCKRHFSALQKSLRSVHVSCSKCRSVAAAYSLKESKEDKHLFWLSLRIEMPACIDDLATQAKFGYSAYDLGPKSKRPVVAICSFCKKDFQTSFCIVAKPSSKHACKKCDAVASKWKSGDKEKFRKDMLDVDRSRVDAAATFEEFGYGLDQISAFSTKKIVSSCSYCGDPLRLTMAKFSSRKGNLACAKCVRKKTVSTLKEKYGVSCTLDIPSVREQLANPMTEQIVETLLRDTYRVEFVRGYAVGPYSFDFYIPSCNLLLECQGDFFHGFKQNGYSGTPQDRAKSSYIEANTGYKLVWVWEHEIHIGRVKKVLDFHIGGHSEPEVRVLLKSLVFKKIQNADAHAFLSKFHYLGNLGTVATCYGAFHEGLLVAVCAFGGVTRNQSIKKANTAFGTSWGPLQLKELRRFCIRPNASAKNMGSFCLTKFVNAYSSDFPDVAAVLSFSDSSVDDFGTVYKAANWRSLPETGPSYHYCDPQTNRRIHKRTVWDMAKGSHMSEPEFAASSGLIVVKEEPKSVWLMKVRK